VPSWPDSALCCPVDRFFLAVGWTLAACPGVFLSGANVVWRRVGSSCCGALALEPASPSKLWPTHAPLISIEADEAGHRCLLRDRGSRRFGHRFPVSRWIQGTGLQVVDW